jgi:hypothetical protein
MKDYEKYIFHLTNTLVPMAFESLCRAPRSGIAVVLTLDFEVKLDDGECQVHEVIETLRYSESQEVMRSKLINALRRAPILQGEHWENFYSQFEELNGPVELVTNRGFEDQERIVFVTFDSFLSFAKAMGYKPTCKAEDRKTELKMARELGRTLSNKSVDFGCQLFFEKA